MTNNKKTIFQKLNTIFDASGVNLTNVNKQTQSSINKYSISNDVLLKTQSKEEYESAKLQAQQSKFLSGLWRKTENELLQHSMHYETTRIGSYADFESMEFYPEIAAALDIISEEATKGCKLFCQLYWTSAILRNMKHPDIESLNNIWYQSILRCGTNCQISFDIVSQQFQSVTLLPLNIT